MAVAQPLIVGLDPSPAKMGWAVLNDETELPVACGVKWLENHTSSIHRATEELAAGFWPHGDVAMVVVEFVVAFTRRDVKGALIVNKRLVAMISESMGQAAAAAALTWPDAEIVRMQPQEWRKANGLKTNASKAEVHKRARELGWETGGNQDAADAGLMAFAGLGLANSRVR